MNHCSGQSKATVEDVGTREEKSVLSFPTPYSACQAMQEQEVVGSEGAGGPGGPGSQVQRGGEGKDVLSGVTVTADKTVGHPEQ